jgi:hypothetical protein
VLVFAAEPGSTRRGSLDAGDGQLVAFLCGGTRDVTQRAVPAAFGAGRAPPARPVGDHGTVDTTMAVVGLAALLVVAVLAAAATRRRRDHSPSGGGANP